MRLIKCKANGCSNKFKRERPFQSWCSTDCAISIANEKLAVVRKKRIAELKRVEKDKRKRHREDRQRIKTLNQIYCDAQTYINRLRRLQDELEYGCCISCGGPIDDAGHYHAIGSKYRCSPLRLNHMNIHGQCARCNRFVGGGNKKSYADGIIVRYGAEYLERLEDLKRQTDRGEMPALSKDEIVAIKRSAIDKFKSIKLRQFP